MRERLLYDGYVRVFEENARKALVELANKLKQEGHAVVCEETFIKDKATSVTAHHYRTCRVCQP